MAGKNYLNVLFSNVRMQTGFGLEKQQEIESFIKRFNLDIVHLQEVHINDDTFLHCNFIRNNFNLVFNNNEAKTGTACLIKMDLEISNVDMDSGGRAIAFDVCKHSQFNVYLPSGTDSLNKNKREEYFSLILPQLLINRRNIGIIGGDFNCIDNKVDCSNNPESKISLGLKKLINLRGWVDSLRKIDGKKQIFSRFYRNSANLEGARLD